MSVSKRRFTNSLSYTLAKNSVLVALIVGLSLSIVQIGFDYTREQGAIEKFATEILAANQFAAADATFHLDSSAAEEVAKGILQYHYIISVVITNESDEILAKRTSDLVVNNQHEQTYKIFGDVKRYSQPLHSRSGEYICNLTIFIDPVLAAEGFLNRSLLVLVSGLIRNILLAFILIFVFYYTTSKKIIAICTALKNLDPSKPIKNSIPVLNLKKKNELDDLGDGINQMLEIMSNDIQDREIRELELHASQIELTYQANHDALSGLVNRRGFEDLLNQASQSKNRDFVLCYLDLDQFKIINDTCGHIAGDELLHQISQLIKKQIRSNDILARLGGDEFGILMHSCSIDKVGNYRFFWDNKSFAVTVSIGIAPITSAIIKTNDLLRNADIACYAAKGAGRNCFRIYEEGISDAAQVHGDMIWVNKINDALKNDHFCLFGQKIVRNGKPYDSGLHYEVSLRMLDQEGNIIAPNAFLPAAERYHLMTKIDTWVIKNQFEYLSTHLEHLSEIKLCTINISGPSLTSPGFQQVVIDNLERYKIPAFKICFEITETAAISNLTDANAFIDSLRDKGCRFALDDFGIGLSSFAYLKYLPVDFIKIDGVFVKGIVDDPIDYAMVKLIHELTTVMVKRPLLNL